MPSLLLMLQLAAIVSAAFNAAYFSTQCGGRPARRRAALLLVVASLGTMLQAAYGGLHPPIDPGWAGGVLALAAQLPATLGSFALALLVLRRLGRRKG